MPTLHHEFDLCVGDSLDDAWFLARRFETRIGDRGPEEDLDRTESWIGRVKDGKITDLWGTRTNLWSLVRGAGGVYTIASRYASAGWLWEQDGLWRFGDDGLEPFTLPSASFSATGLLGLADGTVIVFGSRRQPACQFLRFDGSEFSEMPAPDLDVLAMHGVVSELLVAGGTQDDVAIWDGRAWGPPARLGGMEIPTVLAANPERVHAASFIPTRLFRHGMQGWVKVAEPDRAISALAEYGNAVYVAVSQRGLARVDGDRLVVLPLPVKPLALHSGAAALLMTEEQQISETSDFQKVRQIRIDDLAAALADRTPLWLTRALDSDPNRFVRKPERSAGQKPTEYAFSLCLGRGFDDAYFLATRGEDIGPQRWEAEEREAVVGRIVDGRIRAITTARPLVWSAAISPTGRFYLAVWKDGEGLWRTDADRGFQWEKFDVPALQGLCVIDDNYVICWTATEDAQPFYLFDGRTFQRIPSPPERVLGIGGCARDFVVATGHNGMVARWDGQSWQRWPLAVRGVLGSVYVVSPDEIWATGPTGVLVEGSRHGWTVRAVVPGMAIGVAKFKNDVFVGDPVTGLLRLQDDELVPVKLPVRPRNLCASQDALLMTERVGFTETRDLKTVRRIGAYELDVALRDHEPSWRR